ncbi:MAG TPA: type VI secretion system ATPase TssH [Polyangia bacterium]|jgi:type VI secretion ATPase, ClpV1 family|nr:type VI secretion system ATPase TssH [Polyangia bacterium]
MSEIARVSLFGKLNGLAYKAIESATVFCKLRGNPYVELVHWFNQILQLPDSDLHHILQEFRIDPSRLARDLIAALDQLPRGATSISDLSSHVEEAVERGWVYATLLFDESQVRTGHLLVGILKTPGLRNSPSSMSREFDKVKVEQLTERWNAIVKGSPEESMGASDGFRADAGVSPGESSGAMPPAAMGKQEALHRFSVDLTERARSGEMDPIVGRDEEIRQIVDILMRRRQNNPILTGEAGVGKTAVVEGFAQRIVRGDVPPPLLGVSLRVLDIGLLQAGASMKGEFENRLRQVIDEVQSSAQPIILFIDEAHTLIGAGGAAGTGDAANLLKPALARGKLRTIAATTWAEYKKHIEKDPALTRRFQVVQVGEPDETKALLMMRGTASALEKHHRVLVLDEALEAAVKLSHRYIPARQLPDKAVSLLDTSCARVAISQHAVPAEVEDSRRRIQGLETELEIIRREAALGLSDAADRGGIAQEKLRAERQRLAGLEERWAAERKLVDQILELRGKLRGSPEAAERAAWLDELHTAQAALGKLQGEQPLILPTVDRQAVASVVGDWTGIPVGRMVKNEIETVLRLAETLGQRVIGQRHALDAIARRIQTSRAGIENPNKPIGVFMLAGPSGVGKTETALALAETLYGGEQNAITINMSEFQEAHTVSTLKGAPPGYVGYGEGGVLTEAVRRRPYSVVLLDEVEKAHPDVHEIFFQVFDKGWMEDGEGRVIDFKNTLIFLTTNVGSELILNLCKDPAARPDPEQIAKALRKPLLKTFPAALLGRMVAIPYYPLDDETIGNIARLQLGRVAKRVLESHRIPFVYDDAVVKLIAGRCTELESGGRTIDSILTNTLLPRISQELLTRTMQGKPATRVATTVNGAEFEYAFD